MNRRVGTAVLLGFLSGALFVGCRGLGESLTDNVFPQVGNENRPAGGGGGGTAAFTPVSNGNGNANGGNNNNAPATPAVYTTRLGVQLLIACPTLQADVDCDPTVFACQADAQAYFSLVRAATGLDCHGLDTNGDLTACEALPATCP